MAMDNYRYRILMVIPNLGKGGAQQVFRQQFIHLSTEFDVMGCVFNWDGSFPEDRTEKIISLNVPAGKTIGAKVLFFVTRILRLRTIKKKHKIDIAISHLEGADYVNILSHSCEKIICWIHGTKFHDKNISGFLGWLRLRFMMPLLYKRADQIVTVSRGIEAEFYQKSLSEKSRLRTIYNGFDLDSIRHLSGEHISVSFQPLFHHSKVVVTHCRLSRQKNLKALLMIFSKLSDDGYRLVILGDGEQRQELLDFCRTLDLRYWDCWSAMPFDSSVQVYFLGHQKNPYPYLKQSNLFIMTSAWEGFPLALCEAIICERRVITSDCYTGPREILMPTLTDPQPVQVPFETDLGVLMPIPDTNDEKSIELWSSYLVKLINDPLPITPFIINTRTADWDYSETIKKTRALVQQLMIGE